MSFETLGDETLTARTLRVLQSEAPRSVRVLCTPDAELAALELFVEVARALSLGAPRRVALASLPTWSAGPVCFELIVLELRGERLVSIEIEREGQRLQVLTWPTGQGDTAQRAAA